jgi:uncharacterized membrane protein (UPF0127 family)
MTGKKMRRITTAMMVMAMAAACAAQTSAPSTQATTQAATVAMTIAKKEYKLEIAADGASREHGLMFRESMADDHGMIFIFPKADRWSFWMKNTLIPLDLIWADESGKIVDTTTLQPKDETAYTPRRKAIYVIELNAGAIKKLGIKPGDMLEIPAKLPEAK